MTAEKTQDMNTQAMAAPARAKSSKRASTRRTSAKRAKKATSRTTASRKRSAAARKAHSKQSALAPARLLSRGRKAAGNAYGWAAESASRALPLAVRRLPDQRTVQRFVDERPYVLGAIGLGLGAMIGLMLPSPLGSMGSSTASARHSRSSGRSHH